MNQELLQEINRIIRAKNLRLSAAESCTGGNISRLICSIPGCSDYYLGSVTSYANSVKINVLGVQPEVIESFGAVSSECVGQMADGVRKLMGSDISVATSGIAGPGGGSNEKPVGLVWIGISSPRGVRTLSFQTQNEGRDNNVAAFTTAALQTLLNELQAL